LKERGVANERKRAALPPRPGSEITEFRGESCPPQEGGFLPRFRVNVKWQQRQRLRALGGARASAGRVRYGRQTLVHHASRSRLRRRCGHGADGRRRRSARSRGRLRAGEEGAMNIDTTLRGPEWLGQCPMTSKGKVIANVASALVGLRQD